VDSFLIKYFLKTHAAAPLELSHQSFFLILVILTEDAGRRSVIWHMRHFPDRPHCHKPGD
jgi:hypothetical protein